MVARGERTMGRTILAAVTGVYLVWLLLPIAYIVLYSFDGAITATRWEGFSLRWWAPWRRGSIFADPAMTIAARHTLSLAVVAAGIALVLGTSLALGIRHLTHRTAFTVYALLVLAIAFPAVALADMLWILFSVPLRDFPFGEFGWFGTRAQVLGLATLELPFVALIVSARLAFISDEQEEMAADLGAPPHGVIRRVLLPQMWAAIGAAAAVAISIGLGEAVLTDALRSTDDTRTLASSFFSRDLSPKTYALGAAVAVVGFISSALVLSALRLGKRIRS
jgi:spermidine/putrescine transport system permease protein